MARTTNPDGTCIKCGNTHTKCAGHSKQNKGRPCGKPPIPGGKVCEIHGGKAPHIAAAAKRKLLALEVQADATRILAHEGITGVEDPLEAMALLASEVLAMKEALAARVNALNSIVSYDDKGAAKAAVEMELYERALDRSLKFLDVLARSGIDERRTRITEQIGNQFVTALGLIFERLQLSEAQRGLVPTVVPQVLRELEA